jgi:predicted transcriptional regulator
LPNGGSCPSTQSLQKRMGNSKSRFYHALNILQYLGLVKVQSGKGSGKGGRNVYIAKWWHEWPENTIHCFQASADYAKRGTRL